jgi:hypothetical protein
MFLHLGSEVRVKKSDIIGVFDLDSISVTQRGREFLRASQNRGEVTAVGVELPKSAVLVKQGANTQLYLSPISCAALLKRFEAAVM